MKTYLFNVMLTVEVEAENKEQAYEILNEGTGGDVRDRDVLLVEESEGN